MKKVLLMFLITVSVFTQETLVLKNGSYMKVKQLPDFSGKVITVETLEGRKMSLRLDMIDVEQTRQLKKQKKSSADKSKKSKPKAAEVEPSKKKKDLNIEDFITPRIGKKHLEDSEPDDGESYEEKMRKQQSEWEYREMKQAKDILNRQLKNYDRQIQDYKDKIRALENKKSYISNRPYTTYDMYHEQQRRENDSKTIESYKDRIRELEKRKDEARESFRKRKKTGR